ncbi:MAG: hypothetical protein ACKO6B_15610, partial [Planctomycetia bacterium]
MATGLFDTSPEASIDGVDGEGRYRAIAGTAIAAAVLAVLSPVAFLDWSLTAVPAVGLVLGLLAYRTITQRPEDFTGRPLA